MNEPRDNCKIIQYYTLLVIDPDDHGEGGP